jgi:hypothetical protein
VEEEKDEDQDIYEEVGGVNAPTRKLVVGRILGKESKRRWSRKLMAHTHTHRHKHTHTHMCMYIHKYIHMYLHTYDM